ncbi:MAG TPA: deoxyribonuclease IV [Pirellulales bacterium]|nr:deoxyribonuclease IV [Pirellulales bacterium]
MPILGAHQSIAGGYYRAVELAARNVCECVQIFTKNNNQWRAKELTDEDAQQFKAALERLGIRHPLAHDSYLINLASADDALWTKSIEALVVELRRADRLGIEYVVTHPGAFTSGTEETGIRRIIAALDAIHEQTPGIGSRVLLENTAGQGSTLGWRLEQIQAMLEGVADHSLLGVCIDTCHLFAAGYPLATREDYEATMDRLDSTVGLARIKAIHLNDSKRPLGSRVDRHEHIGRGALGLEPFRQLLNDQRFRDTPMYLETPKEQENGEEMDMVNLRVLRGLVGA